MIKERQHLESNNDIISETIKKLYPKEKFPANLFPDIYPLLHDFFKKSVNSRENGRDFCPDDKEKKKIEEIVIKNLNFEILLNRHPQTVILIYRKCIEKFIFYKHRNRHEREDILQEIITRLIEDKIYKIREKYNFNLKNSFTFTSYLMVTVRNIYIDIIRERCIRPLTGSRCQPIDNLFNEYENDNMMNKLLVEEEVLKLQTIIKLYYKLRPKLELCLKLKYRIPLAKEDTYRCFPQCSRTEIETLSQDFKRMKDKTMFERVSGVFNRHENKKSKSDTIRKWIFVRIDEIISHLNRTHNAAVYNRKNVGELVSFYYHQPGRPQAAAVSNQDYF